MPLPLEQATFAFLDVETTGLNPHFGDNICELAVLKTRGNKTLGLLETLVNPRRSISPGARAVNGISDEMVKDAPFFDEVVEDFRRFIKGAVIVSHNAAFDLAFVARHFRRLEIPLPKNRVIDTLILARRYYRFPSNSLQDIARSLPIASGRPHRAGGDVLTTREVFEFFLRDFRKKDVKTIEGILRLQGGSVAFPPSSEIILPAHIDEVVRRKKRIYLRYLSAGGEETWRGVDPIEITSHEDYLYLIAFCHLRREERTFRLDRILEIGTEGLPPVDS